MMYIEIKSPNGGMSDVQWHVGEKNPTSSDLIHNAQNVLVQADGDELKFVIINFMNVPTRPGKMVQIWSGDFAKFIVMNL